MGPNLFDDLKLVGYLFKNFQDMIKRMYGIRIVVIEGDDIAAMHIDSGEYEVIR